MDIKQAFAQIIDEVYTELMLHFTENHSKKSQLGEFGEIFYLELNHYLSDGGKRVRPFLVLTAFDAVGGNHMEGNITRAALSIELLHNGSLLHDDVIDKDETRRGKPSFHVKFRDFYEEKKKDASQKAINFGEAMSIFAGDLCFPYAIESLLQCGFSAERRIKALSAFAQAFREVIDGVILETGDAILHDGNEETYRKMINLKTGALIRKSVEIGAILGGGTESQLKALETYSNGLGISFQVQDDILGIMGNPEELGKPVGGDIREDKQTILRIHAMQNGSSVQIKRLEELMGKEDISLAELDDVKKIFTDTGAIEYALQMINEATTNAINALNDANPPLKEKPKNLLIALAKYLESRKK